MDLLAAQKCLLQRMYRWSLDEAAREAIEDYPLLKSISNPGVSAFIAIVAPLSLEQRLLLAKAFVKNAYFQAPEQIDIEQLLGDGFSSQERELALNYMEMSRHKALSGELIKVRQGDCLSVRPKHLAKDITQHLSSVMQANFVREESYIWKNAVHINDWRIQTDLHFTGQGVECSHWLIRRDDPCIVSTDCYQQFIRQSILLDYVRRLGVSSTWWIVGSEHDVLRCLDSAGVVCKKVLSQLPSLLQGLEVNDAGL